MKAVATRGAWKDSELQSRFLGLIRRGYEESEAVALLNESNAAVGSDLVLTLPQYHMFKRRHSEFGRAVAAAMEERVAELNRSALDMALESDQFTEKMRYLEFNEKKVTRLQRTVQREEEHDSLLAAAGPATSESDLVAAAAKKRQRLDIIEVSPIGEEEDE